MSKRHRAAALVSTRPVDPPREYFTAPPERWNHGQVEAARPMARMATRVCSGVDLLLASGAIGDAEVVAAERWRLDFVCGVLGVRESERVGDSGRGDAHDAQIARSEAITRHRAIAEIIGAGMTQWLVAFLVEDLTLCAMSRRFTPGRSDGRREMRGRMVALLMLLPGLYAAIDRKPSR